MLLSLWFLALLCSLAAVVVALWVALGVRRRRRRRGGAPVLHGWKLALARAGLSLAVLALVLASIADGVNRHFSYIPSFAALRGHYSPYVVKGHVNTGQVALGPAATVPDHGTVEQVSVPGEASGIGPRKTYVYLPPQYFDPAQQYRRFPVLYLIHGSPGTSDDWLRGGYIDRSMDRLIREGTIDPFIVVLPDVNGGYRRDVECNDVVNGPQAQTYLVTDVVHWVDGHYRTVPDRTGRAIGGLSTGGYCGLNLTFRHQDVYSAAVSHSGYGRPDRNAYTGDLFGSDKARRDANTPDTYLPTIPLQLPIGVYLDAGSGDGESRRAGAGLYDVLHRRGVTVTFNVVDGESHDFVAWRRNLRLSLPWVSQWFRSDGATSGRTTVAAPDTSDLPPPSPTDVELVHHPVAPRAKRPAAGPTGTTKPVAPSIAVPKR
ncbi:MAG TPA: alpha/beta hydrolase-fold protein [Acidimicrobiales bacterium]|nr:alpha/beta hydrolase-fold protein [Acidimicrobiales bacterium]